MGALPLKIRIPSPPARVGVAAEEDAWAAFEALVRTRHADLRRFAIRLVGDAGGAEDALQEAYLKAYRALGGFRETNSGSQAGWLYRIVYRTCLDELRRARARRTVSVEDVAEPVDPAAGPERTTIVRASLSAALARLPAEARAAVLLVDGHAFDYATAAEILEVPRGTIASRLSVARATLREALGDIDDVVR